MNVVPCFEAKKKPSPTIITGDKLTEQEGVYAPVGSIGELSSKARLLVIRHFDGSHKTAPVVLYVDEDGTAIFPAVDSWHSPKRNFIRLSDAVVHFSISE